MKKSNKAQPLPVKISEEDVIEAMRSIQGYIDITPADFREVCQIASALALKRLLNRTLLTNTQEEDYHVLLSMSGNHEKFRLHYQGNVR